MLFAFYQWNIPESKRFILFYFMIIFFRHSNSRNTDEWRWIGRRYILLIDGCHSNHWIIQQIFPLLTILWRIADFLTFRTKSAYMTTTFTAYHILKWLMLFVFGKINTLKPLFFSLFILSFWDLLQENCFNFCRTCIGSL